MNWYKNITGAFSDSAVLFPLLALLSTQPGALPAVLLFSAGVAYCLAGILFRIPMPVQPLKAVAIAAITLGATALEVKISGALVGVYCLLAVFLKWDRYINKVPLYLVHGLQVGLGIVMILKGLETVGPFSHFSISAILLYGATLFLVLYVTETKSFPLLGVVATLGLVWGMVFRLGANGAHTVIQHSAQMIRPELIGSLVLPQLILTSANSVIGTVVVAKKYFAEKASKVTAKRLFLSIGFGNLIFSAIGGLPFCHGAGGLTAHVKGGSYHWISSWIIGLFLMILAGMEWWFQSGVGLHLPAPVISLLLVSVGLLHIQLAAPSWQRRLGAGKRSPLILMGIAALLTQNLLWVLVVGVCCMGLTKVLQKEAPNDTNSKNSRDWRGDNG